MREQGLPDLALRFRSAADPRVEQDVARYTALYIPQDRQKVAAVTRLVRSRLSQQRSWPSEQELLERVAVYGMTHRAGRARTDTPKAALRGSLRRQAAPRPSCRA